MKENPIILLLESSTEVCSVAISKGDTVLAINESAEGNRHSEWMTSYIEKTLEEANLRQKDLDTIAVSQGPGSYTGLRVAYSVGKGIAYALQLPLIEVNTLESLAVAYLEDSKIVEDSIIISMIDARRMEVYQCIYDHNGRPKGDISATILDETQFQNYLTDHDRIIVVGNGASKVEKLMLTEDFKSRIIIQPEILCSAKHLASLALKSFKKSEFSDIAYCVPLYLKSPNITTSTKHLLVKT